MRAVIFANGELGNPQCVQALLRSDDFIIAVDGGTRHALAAEAMPHVVVGDLDSLAIADKRRVEGAGVRIISFPPEKDETDLELALLHAVSRGAREIVVLAALGGRLDQTIANLHLLALPELSGVDVRIIDGAQTAFLIRGGQTAALVEGQPGDTVSLIPLGGDAVGVRAAGLQWTLDDETLCFGPARGISNVRLAGQARLSVRRGMLLCVVIAQRQSEGPCAICGPGSPY